MRTPSMNRASPVSSATLRSCTIRLAFNVPLASRLNSRNTMFTNACVFSSLASEAMYSFTMAIPSSTVSR